MEIRQFNDLGYTLTTVKTDKFKTNLVSLSFQSEINRENVTKRSLIPYVLRASSHNYPTKKDLNTYLESLYGASLSASVEKRGKAHTLKFYLSVANEKFIGNQEPLLEKGVELLKEVVLNPLVEDGAFKEQVVETEKRLLEEYIESLYDDKTSYALQKLVENMCQNERFSINSMGYIKDLAEIDKKSIYGAYQDMWQQDHLTISVVGDIDHEAVYQTFKKHFSLKSSAKKIESVDLEEKQLNQVKIIEEAQDIAQGKLNMGYRTHTRIKDEDYLTLLVFNGMFGGYAHSKLFVNVREKASLCYYCASRLDNYKGLMYVYSGIEPQNYEQAIEIIDQQLADMVSGNFTEQELDLSKKSLINTKLESLDQASGMLAHEVLNELLPKPLTIEQWIEKVQSISGEQIQEVAKKIEKDTVFFLTGKEVPADEV